MSEVLLQIVWVAAHHGLRARCWSAQREAMSGDAAPFPRIDIWTRMWNPVHQLTAKLGNPPAPGGPR